MFGRGDVAYAGSLEATLRDKIIPLAVFCLLLDSLSWIGMEIFLLDAILRRKYLLGDTQT